MVFIETPVFTRELPSLMDDDDYQALQIALLMRPTGQFPEAAVYGKRDGH